MSGFRTSEWLLSHNRNSQDQILGRRLSGKAKSIAFSSGKGGVGKTSLSLKMATSLVESGHKVLLIDCDFNLSNAAVKLGVPLNNSKFTSLISGENQLNDVLYKDGNFHLLNSCNGDLDLYSKDIELEEFIIKIIMGQENVYDYIILDCPAGLLPGTMSLNAYCDYRFFIVTPDKSSLTDSYSMIKILNQKYGVQTGHLIFNKISSKKQFNRLAKSITQTAFNYLTCRLGVLGAVPFFSEAVDEFDQELLKIADSKIGRSFNKILKNFTEEDIGLSKNGNEDSFVQMKNQVPGQDVQSISIS
jgi:flagellar biosynthesis protein FlhG